MSEEGWSWWVGSDGDRYTTECETREQAISIAVKDYEGAYIVEAKKPDGLKLSDQFDVADFLECANDNAYDEYADPEGDGEVFSASDEQMKDLEAVVKSAMDEWQARQGLVFTSFKFCAQRNGEYIPARIPRSPRHKDKRHMPTALSAGAVGMALLFI